MNSSSGRSLLSPGILAWARRELEAIERRENVPPLLDFVPATTPKWSRPDWLAPYSEVLERAPGGGLRVVVAAPPQHGKPLAAGTMVTMGDGSRRPIEQIQVGDRVVSGAGRVTTVTGVYDQGELPVLRIDTLQGRTIWAEGSHRFLTPAGWKRADELRPYDRNAWQRPRGDALLAPFGYQTEASGLDARVARLLGYLVSDGGTSSPTMVRFTCADELVLADFQRIVTSLGDEVVCEMAGKLAPEKTVPAAIFASSTESIAAFLAGYFACDGFRGRTGARGVNSEFYSTSRELLRGCQSLLARLGIRSKLTPKNGRYNGEHHASWRLTILDQVRFFERVPVVGAKAGAMAGSRRMEPTGPARDTIVSVRPDGTRHCHCITVADDDSFLAEDIVTHNTELSTHAFVRILKLYPELRSAYATYSQTRADSVSRKTRAIANRANVSISGPTRAWTTPGGGQLLWTSVGGPLTGEPVDGLLLVDDPYKDRKQAESAAYSQQVVDWLDDVAETRVHPGASIIVMATRWTPKDLSGVLIKRGWQYINIKAIADGIDQHPLDRRLPGEPLCPERKPIEELLRLRRINPFSFASLFQGEPRPRGGALFNQPHYYTELPTNGLQFAYGTDLSYSGKTQSDWSVCVRMAREPLGITDAEGRKLYRYYVLHVDRRQVQAPVWAELLKTRSQEQGFRGQVYWRAFGPEKGSADFIKKLGVRIIVLPGKADKYTHAQPFAEAWNDGRVLVPRGDPARGIPEPEWVEPFVDEITSFTGKDGMQDDQVDAAVAAFDGLERTIDDLTIPTYRMNR